MTYDPKKHRRRSIRLKGYDYSQAGRYFVTICCQGGVHRFGAVRQGIMYLNDAGCMAWHWYHRLDTKYPDIRCDAMIVMPNHLHFVLVHRGDPMGSSNGGSDGWGKHAGLPQPPAEDRTGKPMGLPPKNDRRGEPMCSPHDKDAPMCSPYDEDAPTCSPHETHHPEPDLGKSINQAAEASGTPLWRAVQWYKTMTTNAYIRGVREQGWEPFEKRFLQRNYYEHIIRNEAAYQRIVRYIHTNPRRWKDDRFYDEEKNKLNKNP